MSRIASKIEDVDSRQSYSSTAHGAGEIDSHRYLMTRLLWYESSICGSKLAKQGELQSTRCKAPALPLRAGARSAYPREQLLNFCLGLRHSVDA
jgi:hypothetical protein